MSAVIYNYKTFRGLKFPIVNLSIFYEEGWYPVGAYVDSGATYSVFSAQVADQMGLSYTEGHRKYVQVGNGAFIPIYLHDLMIQVGKHRLTVPIGFSSKIGVSFNLLGRAGIFDFFKVCFHEQRFLIKFYPYS